MLRRLRVLFHLLLFVELLDELYSGVIVLSAGGVQQSFAASYTGVSGALLFVPAAIAMVVEPAIFVLADRHPRGWFLVGGAAFMALGGLLIIMAPSLVWLAIAMSLVYVGSGAGVALAQATLVDQDLGDASRALARWTFAGELGDLLAPALVGAVAYVGWGWRTAIGAVAVAVGLWAMAWCGINGVLGPEQSERDNDEEPEPSILAALGLALRNKALMVWLLAVAFCDLLDDVIVVFAVLYLESTLGATVPQTSLVMGAGVLGALAGLVLTDFALRRFPSERILWSSSVLCFVSFLFWIYARSIFASTACFFIVGLAAAPMYPIAMARAYAALPGRSGTVNAVLHLYSPLQLLLPMFMGFLADTRGLFFALLVSLLQPLGLFFLGIWGEGAKGTPRSVSGPGLPRDT